MHLIEKRSPAKIENCSRSQKVKIATTFLDGGTGAKVGVITQMFTCANYQEGPPAIITNLIECLQFVAVYCDNKQVFTKVEPSWDKAIKVIRRERTFLGRFINRWFL